MRACSASSACRRAPCSLGRHGAAIEAAARTIDSYHEKQGFLHAVYETFFQAYSTDTAHTHGIVYTPRPTVRWMVASVDEALRREFGLSLGDRGVHLLDLCVGTGTFVLELMERIGPSALPPLDVEGWRSVRKLPGLEVVVLEELAAQQAEAGGGEADPKG